MLGSVPLTNNRTPVKNWLRNHCTRRKEAYAKRRDAEKRRAEDDGDDPSAGTPRSGRQNRSKEPRAIAVVDGSVAP